MKYEIIVTFECSKKNIKQNVEDAKLLSLIVNKTRDESKSSLFIICENNEIDFQISNVELKSEIIKGSKKIVSQENYNKLLYEFQQQTKYIKELKNNLQLIKNIVCKADTNKIDI